MDIDVLNLTCVPTHASHVLFSAYTPHIHARSSIIVFLAFVNSYEQAFPTVLRLSISDPQKLSRVVKVLARLVWVWDSPHGCFSPKKHDQKMPMKFMFLSLLIYILACCTPKSSLCSLSHSIRRGGCLGRLHGRYMVLQFSTCNTRTRYRLLWNMFTGFLFWVYPFLSVVGT